VVAMVYREESHHSSGWLNRGLAPKYYYNWLLRKYKLKLDDEVHSKGKPLAVSLLFYDESDFD